MALKKLKKGELVFNEGDASKSMYFIQNGTIRLYKKKGNSAIELGVVHKGEVIGEMGFLDGGPRSASAEALHDTELMEVTNDKLQEVFKALPPWLVVLLKTVVNRLRSANTKIKQLETASTSLSYGRDGPTQAYTFFTTQDVLKLGMALLLVAARNGEAGPNGSIKIKPGIMQRYANQFLNEHVSKITEFLSVLEHVNLVKIDKIPDPKGEKTEIYLNDINLLETFLFFTNEENLKDHTKKINLSIRGVSIMGLIVKHLQLFPPNAEGIAEVNMAKISELEKQANGGKVPYSTDDFAELVKNKLATELSVKDNANMVTKVHVGNLTKLYRMQLILKEIDTINENKRKKMVA